MRILFLLILFSLTSLCFSKNNPRIVNMWLETAIKMLEVDARGPTIQSRNMFHLCGAMYDVWAVYDTKAKPYFLGNSHSGFEFTFEKEFPFPDNLDSAREIAISSAAYHFLLNRFSLTSAKDRSIDILENFVDSIGIDRSHNLNYQSGSPQALGCYIASLLIEYGDYDNSGESDNHEVLHYSPLNQQLKPYLAGNPDLKYPNHWQPIQVYQYVMDKGFEPNLKDWNYELLQWGDLFVTPEWGNVTPFALREEHKVIKQGESGDFTLYLDPGQPPMITENEDQVNMDAYRWGFLLVALWSAHHDPSDSIMIDISPLAIGSEATLPSSFEEYKDFYRLYEGGIRKSSPKLNPVSGKRYEPNMVLRGDYTRVIAEYWADAVNTASPPGHWFDILNDVRDHPSFVKKWEGKGNILTDFEWDIKANFTLAGAMHDAAIAAWGAKGYYDYVRPISAIRWMADQGQCTDSTLPNYSLKGLPLIDGKIELVKENDSLIGHKKEHLNKLKIWTWKGPDYINNTLEDEAGVGWILAENWWPYQRYSFPTPSFAGYVSGHSTFSIAAAEVLTQITGSPYFPGGIAEFVAKKDSYLVFENGPSMDIKLQWATYHDAANETCLSRIWGGIHPPADDIEGRKIGFKIGQLSVELANDYFKDKVNK